MNMIRMSIDGIYYYSLIVYTGLSSLQIWACQVCYSGRGGQGRREVGAKGAFCPGPPV